MNKKRLFRFEMEVETTIKVENVKDTDYGSQRYLKQLVNAFDKDPESLRSIILINFMDSYCGDYREELEPILGNQEDEQVVILKAAKKCTPEAFHYFSDLFADVAKVSGKKARPGDKNKKILLNAGKGEELVPDDAVEESNSDKAQELEWLFGELIGRMCKFETVHAAFSESPVEKNKPSPGMSH